MADPMFPGDIPPVPYSLGELQAITSMLLSYLAFLEHNVTSPSGERAKVMIVDILARLADQMRQESVALFLSPDEMHLVLVAMETTLMLIPVLFPVGVEREIVTRSIRQLHTRLVQAGSPPPHQQN